MSNTTTTTRTMPTTPDAAIADYAAGDRAAKSAIRAHAERMVSDAVRASDMVGAIAWQSARDTMATERAASVVDYAAIVNNYAATLACALSNVTNVGIVAPDGNTYAAVVADGVADESRAARMVPTFRKSGRGNVAEYVDRVLGDDDAMTATDVHNAWSTDGDFADIGYADGPPSVGAIGAFFMRDGDTGPSCIGATVDMTGTRRIARDA